MPDFSPSLSVHEKFQVQAKGLALMRGSWKSAWRQDFVLETGSCTFITGENGSGKSSLLRCLAGLLPVGSGEIIGGGDNPWYFPATPALPRHLTVLEAANWVLLHAIGIHPKSDVLKSALARFGLGEQSSQRVSRLSSGQRQRLYLLRLDSGILDCVPPDTRPVLYLLDEPYSHLDTGGQTLLNALIDSLVERGGIVVIAHHIGQDGTLPKLSKPPHVLHLGGSS